MLKKRFNEITNQYSQKDVVKDLSIFSSDQVWNQKTLDTFFENHPQIQTEKITATAFFDTPIAFFKDQIQVNQDNHTFQLTRIRTTKKNQEFKSFILAKNPPTNLMASTALFSTSPAFKNIVIMPDGHLTNTNIVGFTSRASKNQQDQFILAPEVIGSDIGCGVLSANFSSHFDQLDETQTHQLLEQLDQGIVNLIPAGRAAEHSLENFKQGISYLNTLGPDFYDLIKKQAIEFLEQTYFFHELSKEEQNFLIKNIISNTATLGDGNHFIEINKNAQNKLQLNIHSGSRTFGGKVYQYYQKFAQDLYDQKLKQLKKETILEQRAKYENGQITLEEFQTFLKDNRSSIHQIQSQSILTLEDQVAQQYFHDLKIAENYARFNREMMMLIIEEFVRKNIYKNENLNVFDPHYHNIHNSAFKIADEIVLLKGSILAQISNITNSPENLHPNAIPLNMNDGIINTYPKYDITNGAQYNFSLPHGAGRNSSRKQFVSENKTEKLADFQKMMNGIVSSCVLEETLDESPKAYKSKNEILEQSTPLFDQDFQIFKPVYSFKGHAKLPFMVDMIAIKKSNRSFTENFINTNQPNKKKQLKK